MREIAHQMFTRLLIWDFPTAYSQTPESIFTRKMVNNAVPRKDVLFRVRKQTIYIYTP